ncbi:Protein BFR2 [Rhodotorula toruloides]|uniref:Protein BFR2 n=1 Tax=Rhodotorula toruloides TaxID=5286 RepID=A0A0K3CCM1_RHOTO|nr:Protein BFR2 [Rhodotorula toruloides]PRQ78168.1 Apoptosis-antagonizing transcription factor, C-terminal-domain containing protein [Rhodotorula toruloides]
MAKRLTLAEQLAQISQPAPQDYDPEEAYATYADNRTSADAADAARAEYVDVGVSKLRKKGEAVLDPKYEGKKGSRAALYADTDDEDEGEEEEYGMNGFGEEDDEDEDEMGDFEDLEANGADEDDGSVDSDGVDGAEDDEDDDEEDEAPARPARKVESRTKQQDERSMVSQLKQAASADVEKGRDVKKQLAFCDSLLESRIKLQKAVGAANLLPQPARAKQYFDSLGDEVGDVLDEVKDLSEELFQLRQTLLATNEKIELPSDFGASRKRKRTSEFDADFLDLTLADLKTLEETFHPFLRSTVTKWSDKVLAASGLALKGGDKKFKAVNQNAMAQIDHAMSGAGERERLIRRTRIRRGEGKVVGAPEGKAEEKELEGEKKAEKEVDVECFDDSDFYQQLLRDVVESRMLDLDDATMNQLRQATALARGKKVKKVVDTRASKGRKIRYHVHEKIQNFMIPIEAASWHDEQIDELFAGLLGRSFPQTGNGEQAPETALDPALDDVPNQQPGEIEVGNLRLFG